MNMTLTPLRKEKGVVLVLVALSLFVLMGVAALAIDLSHAEVNKTRLQNMADALALSAAISLNKQNNPTNSTDEVAAEAYAKANTFPSFKNSLGNSEINAAIESDNLIFTFAKITNLNASTAGDWKAAAGINDADFVRVTVGPMNISTWFGKVIGFNQMAPSTSAVAGFTPIAPCDLAPIMLCAANPTSPDKTCSDGSCYGYTVNNVYCLTPAIGGSSGSKCDASKNSSWGPGNVGFVNLGDNQNGAFPNLPNGASTLGKCLAGDPQCQNYCLYSPNLSQIPPKTGLDWGMVKKGIDDIFHASNNPNFNFSSDTITGLSTNGPITTGGQSSTKTYLDWNIISAFTTSVPVGGLNPSSFPGTVPSPFAIYQQFPPPKIETNLSASTTEYGKRVFNIPFVDCTNPPNGASTTVPVVGFGCFFLTAKAEKQGSEVFILGQFVQDPTLCQSTGKTTSTGNFGFDKVILYKDPLGGHS